MVMERIKKVGRRKTGVLTEIFCFVPVDDPLLMQMMQSTKKLRRGRARHLS
jgi:hypothetical protein